MDSSMSNVVNGLGSTRGRKLLTLLHDIYVNYFFCKGVFYLIILMRYMNLRLELEKHDDQNPDGTVDDRQIKELRQTICLCGVLFVEIGSSAVLGYANSILAYLIFYLTSRVHSSPIINCYQNESLVLLYTNPELSEKQFLSTSEKYLKQLILLNVKKLRTVAKFKCSSLISLEGSKQIVRDLNEQQSQLREMLSDKSAIRPTNRCERWKQEQTKFVLRATMGIFIFFYIAMSAISIFGGFYSVISMAERGEKPNFLEILSVQEMNIAIVLYMETFVSPIVLLLFNLRDRCMTIRTIKLQIRRLSRKLEELSSCHDEQDAKAKGLRSECSRKSLEIYLSMRLFLDELRSSAKLASFIASQYAVFGLLQILLISTTFPRTNSKEFGLLLALIINVGSIFNFSFLLCAALESRCSKLIQLAWSLVAHTMLGNRDYPAVKSSEIERSMKLKKLARTDDWSEQLSECFMFDYLGVSLINEQTALLWRRFVADMQKVHDNFRFTALGLFELNFRGVLRLNFWSISTLLITLTYRSYN